MNNQVFEQGFLLTLLLVLLVLLIWGRWRYDIVALAALFMAALVGVVPQDAMFAGFGNPATITVILVLIISHGLSHSGAVDYVLPVLEPFESHPRIHMAALTFLAAFLSMFMNNVGALALLMPIAIRSTSKAGRPPAMVLMPLSFGSILGGLVTQIGTPPNILIASYRESVVGESFSMFDFTPVGGIIALSGIVFLMLFGWRLVKVRKKSAGMELFDVEDYLFELKVTKESDLLDTRAGELKLAIRDKKLELLSMEQDREIVRFIRRNSRRPIRSGDRLMIQGSHDSVQDFAKEHDLTLHTAQNSVTAVLHSDDKQFSEVVVLPNSPLLGKTPESINFNTTYHINLIAASRSGTPHRSLLRHFEFNVGDVLLLHGDEEELDSTLEKLGCYPLASRALSLSRNNKALEVLLLFVFAILLVAAGVFSIQLGLGLVTVVMVLRNLIPIKEFYDGVDWPVVVLLGAMIPLGTALEETGTTGLLVGGILSVAGNLPAPFILLLILVITMSVSDVLNNAATAIVMAPIAYNIALFMNLNPDAFLMAVAIGASCAFLTPIGHQNNALIMGPGGYKFGDYWRLGLPLEFIIAIIAVPLLMIVWPLYD